jgi:branched-chain amino acid transport system substrate-binding protein
MKTTQQFFGKAALALALAATCGALHAQAQPKVKVGLMLPSTGTYASPGTAIGNGFKLFVTEQGGKLGGREVEYFSVDDESDPSKATENANKLIKRDKVDVLVGTVHSGVALAMAKVARENKTLFLVANAGADELTGPLCAPTLFRTSFSAWQPAYAMGKVVADKGHKRVVTLTWKYSFGQQSIDGFKESFEKGGGKIVKEMTLPFPNVEFQPFLTEIAALKPDAVYVFFAGAGAAKFVRDYHAAGLKNTIPLYASGFLTDGTLDAMGEAGKGLQTTLHYVYAMQGYDAAQLYHAGLSAAGGDPAKQAEIIKAMEGAKVDSPRGTFTLSKAHNPVQDIYLREVQGGQNKVVSTLIKGLADPGRGCKM